MTCVLYCEVVLCNYVKVRAADDIFTRTSRPREYCWEQFEATCMSRNQVILMTSAYYGRMRVGRCVTRDYYIGCTADVIAVLDRKCSGRRNCRLPIPNTEMQRLQPCLADLMAYLEAEYQCVNGKQVMVLYCISSRPSSPSRIKRML